MALAIVITLIVHVVPTLVGFKLLGDTVKGLGSALGTAIRSGALDNFFK